MYTNDVQHIILDNLQFMIGTGYDSNFNKFDIQDHIIGELRKFATNFNCHVTLVIHPRKVRVSVIIFQHRTDALLSTLHININGNHKYAYLTNLHN